MNALMSVFGYRTKEDLRNFLVESEKEGKFSATESLWVVKETSTDKVIAIHSRKTYRANDTETIKKTYEFANNLTQGFFGNWSFAFIGSHDNWNHMGSCFRLHNAMAPANDLRQLEVEIECDNYTNEVKDLLTIRYKTFSDSNSKWSWEAFTNTNRMY